MLKSVIRNITLIIVNQFLKVIIQLFIGCTGS